ncbi:MAG TPA: hypothetical protein VGL08_16445 [Paraburkholderia sp.]
MSSLNIRPDAALAQDDGRDESHQRRIAGLQIDRRQLVACTIAGTVVSATALAAGWLTTEIAVYVAATLPFAYFS